MKNEKIVLKKLRNNLTSEEDIIFQKWVERSDANRTLYNKLLQLKNEGSAVYQISELDVNTAWDAIQENVKAKQRSKVIPFYNRNVLKYAAAILVGVLATTYIFRENLFNHPVVQDVPVIVNTDAIQMGSDKAVLTLGDGSLVVLEKGKTFQSNNIKSTGEQLIYETANTKKEAVKDNYLTIPRAGQYMLTLSDGTIVWLNSESQLKYPEVFIEGENRKVELVYGEAYFDVTSSADFGGSKFIVHNQNQDIEVLGTEFNIKAYKDETSIYTTLVEGQVLVSQDGKQKKLLPNQQSILDTYTGLVTVSTVDVYNEVSWKDGVFVFNEKPLKEIMKVLSRWYDMEVVFINKDIENEEFVGILRKNRSINNVLNSIKGFGTIKNYKISDKNVIIE